EARPMSSNNRRAAAGIGRVWASVAGPVPLASAIWSTASASPSLKSRQAFAARVRPSRAPSRDRGVGRRYLRTHSARPASSGSRVFDAATSGDRSDRRSHSRPASAAPTAPLTYRASPGRPPPRVSTRRGRAVPVTVTSIINGPGERAMFPPAGVTRYSRAMSMNPSSSASRSATGKSAGSASDSRATRATPPIAATSETLTARAFHPMSHGARKRRLKCTPSIDASVVRISRAPRSGWTTAASSPMPTASHAGAAGRRRRIAAMMARSPASATVWLPGELNGPRLTNDGHLDLSRVLELVLDAPCDVFGQPDRLLVRHAVAFADNADLAAGLQGERLRDALERIGDVLELLETFHVGLEDVAAGAGTCRGDRVGRLHDHRFERRPVDVHVMRGDRLQHRFALAVLAQEIETELQVRALQIAVDRLADVVQERGARRDMTVQAELFRHDAGEEGDLTRVVQHVLSVACAELEASHQLQDVRVQVVQPELERRGFSLAAHALFHLPLHLFHHLLDSCRMNAAICDQTLDGLARDLTAERIEGGEDDGARRVVDDQLDAGRRFERADVAPFAADDPAFHVVAGEVHDRHGRFDRVLGGAALDGVGDDLLGTLRGGLARFRLEALHEIGGVAPGIRLDLFQQQLARLFGREAGHALQL